MLTPDALYYASDIKPAAYCNENPGGPCIVVCTNQRNATLCASRQPAVQHLNNPENLSKRARPPLRDAYVESDRKGHVSNYQSDLPMRSL